MGLSARRVAIIWLRIAYEVSAVTDFTRVRVECHCKAYKTPETSPSGAVAVVHALVRRSILNLQGR